jgi:uncharacterized protein YjbI with pentapeptide repeats
VLTGALLTGALLTGALLTGALLTGALLTGALLLAGALLLGSTQHALFGSQLGSVAAVESDPDGSAFGSDRLATSGNLDDLACGGRSIPASLLSTTEPPIALAGAANEKGTARAQAKISASLRLLRTSFTAPLHNRRTRPPFPLTLTP